MGAGLHGRAALPLIDDQPATRASHPSGADLVVCSLEPWDEVWRRNQFLVRELLARDPRLRVLFVEPAWDVAHRAIRRLSPLPARWGTRPVGPDGRVWALQPVKVLPRAVGRFADRSLVRQVIRAVAGLRFSAPTLWVNDSTYATLGAETGWPSLYDITDDWLLEDVGDRERRRREANERRLLADANVVVVCSSALQASRSRTRDVVLVPNAVDTARFRTPHPRPSDLPAGPTAVYVGTLHETRLDVELLVRLATELPAAQVVLIGPNAMAPHTTARLRQFSNVHLLGSRPYGAVPAYFQHADVLIVPHRLTPFTESLDPIKAYECLAAGRPTVATPLTAFRDLGDPVRTSPAETFVSEVARLIENPPDSPPARPLPDWSDRGREFAAALDKARADRPSTTRRRVVYLDHCALLSGAELALLRLLPALETIEAHVILAQDGPLVARLRDARISVEVLPMAESSRSLSRDTVRPGALPLAGVWHAVRYALRLRARLRLLRPDLVHTNSLKSALYGSAAARLAGVPVICHLRDRVAEDYMPAPAVRLVRAVLRILPDLVIANSDATRATLATHTRSAVVYDAVPSGGAVRGRSGGRPLLVGMVGRISPWKGQDVFLRAFARAFPDGQQRAAIVGSAMFGEEGFEAELRRLADTLGIGTRVDFAGFVEDVGVQLAAFDVLVHASVVPEPFGLVVVEGMAAGLPVVASAAGGPLEVITDGLDGRLFPPGDVAALADILTALAADADLRSRLGDEARKRAAAFSPDRISADVSAVYDDLLGTPTATGR